MPRSVVVLAGLFFIAVTTVPLVAGQSKSENEYPREVRASFKKYCSDCHSGDTVEADVDFSNFRSLSDVRRDVRVWQRISSMLETRQMPPQDAPLLPDVVRMRLQKWVDGFLAAEAKSRAGDPGPVVLRRLSNAEYTYSLRDLTGVQTLDPAGEFPIDGAAGEGFTNAGNALTMSPSLIFKYLGAAKGVSQHMVLLPTGVRFSTETTPRDWSDEILAKIRRFYGRYTRDNVGTGTTWQNSQAEAIKRGELDIARYLRATLVERNVLTNPVEMNDVAKRYKLSAKYLRLIWDALTSDSKDQSVILADIRQRWIQSNPKDAEALASVIRQWQEKLWSFNTVGQIGRHGGPSAWQVAAQPGTHEHVVKFRPATMGIHKNISIHIKAVAAEGTDGSIVLEQPRFTFANRPDVLFRDVRDLSQRVQTSMRTELPRTHEYLNYLSRRHRNRSATKIQQRPDHLNPVLLDEWASFVGLGSAGQHAGPKIVGQFANRLKKVQGYDAINGWGDMPSLLTNRSTEAVKFLTLTVPPRGVVVHPSPSRDSFVAWRSPIAGSFRVRGLVADADDKCGNGAAWRVAVESEATVQTIATGTIDNGKKTPIQAASVSVGKGDVIRLTVMARDKNHVCDTTHIELIVQELEGTKRVWNLAHDVVDNILTSNPMRDQHGHDSVWYFGASLEKPAPPERLPEGSALASWLNGLRSNKPADELERQAVVLRDMLVSSNLIETNQSKFSKPDQALVSEVLKWNGRINWIDASRHSKIVTLEKPVLSKFGWDADLFGGVHSGVQINDSSCVITAGGVYELIVPSRLVASADLVTTARVLPGSKSKSFMQLVVSSATPQDGLAPALPILLPANPRSANRAKRAMNDFRELFPAAFCYSRIVPVDEVVTLALFYREDSHLRRLVLDDHQSAELDQLWSELYFVSQEPLKMVTVFEQISEFATQDRPDLVKAFKPLGDGIKQRALAFSRAQVNAEPFHLQAVLTFAPQAWRRDLMEVEELGIREFYRGLRAADHSHDDSIRLTLARILTSPAFLYKMETPHEGALAKRVNGAELATRLSYFLWSSVPDSELRRVSLQPDFSSEERLEDVLLKQTHRMLKDPRVRRLAVHFACQWLHLRDFDQNRDKNEKLYPEFEHLRDDMYEETVLFFEDMFRNDRSILNLLAADFVIVNETLADHYGIEGITGEEWQRVNGTAAQGRGGVLGMATMLASQSGASRTSPILRGNWVSETLLGEKLPRPPANVPVLPEEVPDNLTARQLIERHSSVPECAKCHARIDPYGFALEQYDALGRHRPHLVDTKTTLLDGRSIEGMAGLREYLSVQRRHDFVRQFCRKLLGYALGREVQLSDEPLISLMHKSLRQENYRFGVAVDMIVASPQFRRIRGRSYVEP